jgi:hypothetical protein
MAPATTPDPGFRYLPERANHDRELMLELQIDVAAGRYAAEDTPKEDPARGRRASEDLTPATTAGDRHDGSPRPR